MSITSTLHLSSPAFSRTRVVNRLYQAQKVIIGFYALDGLVLGGFVRTGAVPAWLPPSYFLSGLLLSLVVMWVLRGGWLSRIGETPLTLAQTGLGVLVALTTAVVAPKMGLVSLMTVVSMASTAALRLPPRPMALFSLGVVAGMAWVLVASGTRPEVALDGPFEQTLTVVWLSLLVAKGAGINVVGNLLRVELHNTNKQLVEAMHAVEVLASQDELTGLLNRRSMMKLLHEQQRLHASGAASYAVALLDIDHFKLVNDRFGHSTGDAVLREFAVLMHEVLAPDQSASRHGGEEFLVLMRGVAQREAAQAVLEQLRRRVQQHPWSRIAEGLAVTVSAGVGLAGPGEPVDRLLERTDRALYRAKAEGRNRIALTEPLQPAARRAAAMPA